MSRLLTSRNSYPIGAPGDALPSGDPFDHDMFKWGLLHPDNQALLGELLTLPPKLLDEPPQDDGDTRCIGICLFSRPKSDLQETPSSEELEGKSADEIDEMLTGRGWSKEPADDNGGWIYRNPDRKSDQVRVMPNGTPNTSSPEIHDAPYGRVSKNGAKTRFLLK